MLGPPAECSLGITVLQWKERHVPQWLERSQTILLVKALSRPESVHHSEG